MVLIFVSKHTNFALKEPPNGIRPFLKCCIYFPKNVKNQNGCELLICKYLIENSLYE